MASSKHPQSFQVCFDEGRNKLKIFGLNVVILSDALDVGRFAIAFGTLEATFFMDLIDFAMRTIDYFDRHFQPVSRSS
jgi:hypothetical protein